MNVMDKDILVIFLQCLYSLEDITHKRGKGGDTGGWSWVHHYKNTSVCLSQLNASVTVTSLDVQQKEENMFSSKHMDCNSKYTRSVYKVRESSTSLTFISEVAIAIFMTFNTSL